MSLSVSLSLSLFVILFAKLSTMTLEFRSLCERAVCMSFVLPVRLYTLHRTHTDTAGLPPCHTTLRCVYYYSCNYSILMTRYLLVWTVTVFHCELLGHTPVTLRSVNVEGLNCGPQIKMYSAETIIEFQFSMLHSL